MKNIRNLTAKEILKAKTPAAIFTRETYKREFNILRGIWHEDKNSDPLTHEVFLHLFELNELATSQLSNDIWGGMLSTMITGANGSSYRIKYYKKHKFELGIMYIAKTQIAFVIESEFKDMYKNAVNQLNLLTYPDTKIRTEFKKLMPKVKHAIDLQGGRSALIIEKPAELILLQDLLDYMPNNKLPGRQAAWIGSSLLNMATYFDVITNITHNAIMASTVFVGMKTHYSMILGGWWYASKEDAPITTVPSELVRILPKKLFDEKIARTKYDRLAIKSLVIKCLGDDSFNGSKLLMDKDIPNNWVEYLRSPATLNATDEYTKWYKVLGDTFGKRTFVKLNIDSTDVY